jgi:hypothetical protein
MQIASVAYAPVAPIRPVAPPAPSDEQLATLDSLASVILDDSGKYSGGEKLDAYQASHQRSVTGQYRDVGPNGAKLLNQIAGSGTAQQVEAERVKYSDAMRAAIQQAGASGGSRSEALGGAALKHFDGLSKSDQQALFASINAPNRAGATPFANLDDWRAQMSAMAGAASASPAPIDRVSLSPYALSLVRDSRAAPPGAAEASPAYASGAVADIRV